MNQFLENQHQMSQSKPSPSVSFIVPDTPYTPTSALSMNSSHRYISANSKRESNIRSSRNMLLSTPKPRQPFDNMHSDYNEDEGKGEGAIGEGEYHSPAMKVAAHGANGGITDASLMLVPSSQTIHDTLSALAQNTAQQLEDVWDEIGLSLEERGDQLADLLSAFQEACEAKVTNEMEVLENYKRLIVEYKQEIKSTCNALKIPVDEDLVADTLHQKKNKKKQTLQDEACSLEFALQDLRSVAEVKRRDLREYKRKLEEDHLALGIDLDDKWKDIDSDLTDPRIAEFRDFVQEMDGIVSTRVKAIVQIIRDCKELIETLRIDPLSSVNPLDRQIMGSLMQDEEGNMLIVDKFESNECTGISAKALDDLTQRHKELHNEKRRRRTLLSEMGDTIFELWEKLQVPKEEQLAFSNSVDGLSLDTLAKGEAEISKLLARKEEMMGRLIVDSRKKIEILWEETNATKEQRSTFTAIHVRDENLMNDALLTEHEAYIKVLEDRLTQMKPLLDLIEKREAVLKERMEYEECLKDPSRLQQRGMAVAKQLMKEEKMAKHIKNDLPKYTMLLTKKLREWEEEHSEPFLYNGQDYSTVIHKQEKEWQEYNEQKKQIKLQKKQKENKVSSNSSVFSNSTRSVSRSSSRGPTSAPLGDMTNKDDYRSKSRPKSRPRPFSKLRAMSRGRERENATAENNDEPAPRAKSRVRGFLSRSKSRPRV